MKSSIKRIQQLTQQFHSLLLSIIFIALTGLSANVLAAGGGVELKHMTVNMSDKGALQRGAKLFTDYCLSCHSAKYVRFNRVAEDLDLTEKQVMENLNHSDAKFGSTMTTTMTKEYAKKSFGALPPDLSLVARSRGVDWLYTYLTGFYSDPAKTTGFNNIAFKDVGMPNVLWELQGTQEATFNEHGMVEHLKLTKEGKLSEAEFDREVRSIVSFLSYIGEPRQAERKVLGAWVLVFLAVLFIFAYNLKKEYWKDVPH
ncbi:MAG: cytochrome c1 [Gammaproteobacteria bacterium]|nr:cytochrome c1 [Gammaproteobacteria bacterium]